jgi:ATP-binding cassette subfamily F protein 3
MSVPEVYGEATAFDRVMAQYAQVQRAFEEADGYRRENRAREALARLGFVPEEYHLRVGALSGGQRKLVGIARLLVGRPHVLLLDEPDNHLDLQRKEGLQALIQGFSGAVLLVSHDRYLLDQTVDQIAEIAGGRLTAYQGNYTSYAVAKELSRLQALRRYLAQQKEIAHIEASIARFELWASQVPNERHARQAASRCKMLDRMDRVDQPAGPQRRMGLALAGWRGSERALRVGDLSVSFTDPAGGERQVLRGVSFELRHGERVGLVGPNGCGKSVLLRCILGEIAPAAGVVRIGPNVLPGYYAQQHETLDQSRTLIDAVRYTRPMREGEAVAFLGKFLFDYDAAHKPIAQLSGGERSRLQLAKIMLTGPNLLLLDEPTNNLDLVSCEVLKANIADFEGAVLAVSHDRYFLDRVVDRILEIEDGRIIEYPGDYGYYRQHKLNQA